MKKSFLCLIISFFLIEFSYPQSPEWLWAKNPGGEYAENGNGVATDAWGNVYVTGYFASTSITFDTITLTNPFASLSRMFIVKYNSNGNALWAKTADGISWGEDITTDSLGNAYAIGNFNSDSIIFGDTVIYNHYNYNGYSDIYIVKYDSSGNVIWVKSFGTINNDIGGNISIDNEWNIYFSGWTQSTITIDTISLLGNGSFLVKCDSTCNAIWAKTIPIHSESSILINKDDNIIFTGIFNSTITFEDITLFGNGNWDIFLVKFDKYGNFIWAKGAGGLNYEEGLDVCSDSLGNIFITGFSASPVMYFNGFQLTMEGTSPNNIFIAKYDSNGNVLWVRSEGGSGDDYGHTVSCDKYGNVFLSGSFTSPTIVFGTTTLTCNYVWSDIFVAKYDAEGSVLWAKSTGGSDGDGSLDMAINNKGNLYLTGFFTSSSIAFSTDTLLNPFPGDDDMFIAKLDTLCGFAVEVNNPELCIGDSVTLTAHNAQSYFWSTGETNNSITVSPTVNTTYTVTGTYSNCTASANAVVTINNTYLQPSVIISAYPYAACPGTPVTFTATPTNGGIAPSYQWYLNNIPVGLNKYLFTDTSFVDGDSIFCELTSSYLCTTENPVKSNTIGLTIFPNPAAASIYQSCDTFYSSIYDGNQWYQYPSTMISGANENFYIPEVNGEYYVIITDSLGCHSDTSNNITPLNPVSVSIYASFMPVCPGTPITFTAMPVNGGSTPHYQWYINNIPIGSDNYLFIDSTLSNHDTVWCEIISSDSCSTGSPTASNEIVVSLLPKPPAPMIEQVLNYLESYTPNGNQWYMEPDSLILGATEQFFYPAESGYYYCIVTDTNGCMSDSSEHWHFILSGIPDFSENNPFYIFPNPASDFIQFESKDNSLIKIITIEGQMVKSYMAKTGYTTLDVSALAQGIYFMIVQNNENIIVRKLVKK